MEAKLDVHHISERYADVLQQWQSGLLPIRSGSPISVCDEDRKVILTFIENITAKSIKPVRRLKYLTLFKILIQHKKKPFQDLDKQDVVFMLSEIEGNGYAPATVEDLKMATKVIFREIRGSEDRQYPKEVSWIRLKCITNRLNKSDLITKDELEKLIATAANPRDRAFLAVLYESGCRIAEMLNLRIGNVQIDSRGANLSVDGKTGKRSVRIITATKALTDYINTHPESRNPSAFLWLSERSTGRGKNTTYARNPLNYAAARKLIQTAFHRSGLPMEKSKAHRFRHSRATETAKIFKNSGLQNQYLGWSPNSRMPSVYEHLDTSDIDKALGEAYNQQPPEPEKPQYVDPKCDRCHAPNSFGSVYCSTCAHKLGETIDAATINDTALNALLTIVKTQAAKIDLLDQTLREIRDAGQGKELDQLASVMNLKGYAEDGLRASSSKPKPKP